MWFNDKCFTNVVCAIKVAILFVRLIATIVVVVANFVAKNASAVRFTLEFTFLARFSDMISTVQWVIQRLEKWFDCGLHCDGLFTDFYDRFKMNEKVYRDMKWEEKIMWWWTSITTLNK